MVNSTPSPHAVDRLKDINKDETCQLSLAGDMVMMLIEGLFREYVGVEKCLDEVNEAGLKVSNGVFKAGMLFGVRSLDIRFCNGLMICRVTLGP